MPANDNRAYTWESNLKAEKEEQPVPWWKCLRCLLVFKKFGFGRKKESAPDDNPYAQQSVNDVYTAPAPAPGRFQPTGRVGLPGGPRVGPGGLPSGPSSRSGSLQSAPPSYSNERNSTNYEPDAPPSYSGYGGNGYSQNQAAFTANQFRAQSVGGQSVTSIGSRPSAPSSYSTIKPFDSKTGLQTVGRDGGYGGMGTGNSSRSDLLAGANRQQLPQRVDNMRQQSSMSSATQSFGDYGAQRELSEEEQQKLELRATAEEINRTRAASHQTVDNSQYLADQALEAGRAVLRRLGEQSDRINNLENNLDITKIKQRVAERGTVDLEVASRGMFAVRRGGNSKKHREEEERLALEQHQADRTIRETTRHNQNEAARNLGSAMRTAGEQGRRELLGRKNLTEGHMQNMVFREDGSDEEEAEAKYKGGIQSEEELEGKVDRLTGSVGDIGKIAKAIGNQLDAELVTVDRIIEKTDVAGEQFVKIGTKLDRITKKG